MNIIYLIMVTLAGVILFASIIVNCFVDTDEMRKNIWQEIQKEREEEDGCN